MTDAPRDNNLVDVLSVASNADGSTPMQVKVNASTHILQVDDNTTGSDLSGDNASRDNNGRPVAMGVSEADGVTPVPIYGNPATGKLLIDST
jgi:hypothetical protein